MRGRRGIVASDVVQRIAAGVLGGYALTILASTCLSYVLPGSRFDAVMAAVLMSFPIYVAVVVWVFAVGSLPRLWWWVGGTIAGTGCVAALLHWANAG